jgi:hypothetical protein
MDKLKKRIIREWLKTKTVHPTYRSIGKKCKVTHAYCYQVIKEYKAKSYPQSSI